MTKTCENCDGIGIADGACGELKPCAPCRGAGMVTLPLEAGDAGARYVYDYSSPGEWREPVPTPRRARNAQWSPYDGAT